MLFVMAGLAFLTALIMRLGLKDGTPAGLSSRLSLGQVVAIGVAQGRGNPRLLVCYAGAFISRADLTLVATFISLWLQRVGRDAGLDGPQALAQAGLLFALIQGSALLWAPVAGWLIDRFHRLACVVAALLVGAVGYTLLGLQAQPFSPMGYAACVLVGMGQMSVILSVTGLLGQETPLNVRGSVIGLAGFCGSLGILATSLAGAICLTTGKSPGPSCWWGANLATFVFALVIWLRSGAPLGVNLAEALSATVLGEKTEK